MTQLLQLYRAMNLSQFYQQLLAALGAAELAAAASF